MVLSRNWLELGLTYPGNSRALVWLGSGMAPPLPIEKLGWLNAFASVTPKRKRFPSPQTGVVFKNARFMLLAPAAVPLPRPVRARPTPLAAPAPPWTNCAFELRAT